MEGQLVAYGDAIQQAYDVLNDAFGHADAPYTPAALEAMSFLRAILEPEETGDRDAKTHRSA